MVGMGWGEGLEGIGDVIGKPFKGNLTSTTMRLVSRILRLYL